MHPIEFLQNYAFPLAVLLDVIGILIIIYLLAYAYRNPRRKALRDIFLLVLSAIILSCGLVLHLVMFEII